MGLVSFPTFYHKDPPKTCRYHCPMDSFLLFPHSWSSHGSYGLLFPHSWSIFFHPSLFGSTLVQSSLQVFVAANSNAVLRLVNVQNGMVLQKLKVGGLNQPKVKGEMRWIFVRILGWVGWRRISLFIDLGPMKWSGDVSGQSWGS